MKKLIYTLVLTTITLSSQLEAMWFSVITRSLARNFAQRSIATKPTIPALSKNLMQMRTMQGQSHKTLFAPRTLFIPQTSVLTKPIEPCKSLVPNQCSRVYQEQSRAYSLFNPRAYSDWQTSLVKNLIEHERLRTLTFAIKIGIDSKKVIRTITQDFNLLKSCLRNKNFSDTLLSLINQNATLTEIFTSALTHDCNNIKFIFRNWEAKGFFDTLFSTNPQAAQQFASAITQNITILYDLCRTSEGTLFLEYLIKNNPQTAQVFAPIIIHNIETLMNLHKHCPGARFVELISSNPQAAQHITTLIIQKIATVEDLCNSNYGVEFLERLINANARSATLFTTALTQNSKMLENLCDSKHGDKFLAILMQTDPQAAQSFIFAISQNIPLFKTLCNSCGGILFLNKLMDNNQNAAIQLVPLFSKNMDDHWETAGLLLNKNDDLHALFLNKIEELSLSHDWGNSEKFIKMFQFNEKDKKSPTVQHLRSNARRVLTPIIGIYLGGLNKLYHKALEKEHELQKNNYVTFLHGQRRDYYVPELLYTFLWEIAHNKKTNNFIFTHVKQPATNFKEEQEILKQLRNNGRNTQTDRQRLLFLNYAFFGNNTSLGSSTAQYVIYNNNVGGISLSFSDIFAYFDFKNIYERYKNQLEELQEKYKKLSEEGTLLVIGVPKNRVNDIVYSAHSGGYKRPVHIEGIGESDDTHVILETLLHHPEKIKNTDRIEFCLIMTEKGGGLDPDTGIQVHPLIPCDNEENLQKLENERKTLFEHIAQDIRKQNN